MAKSRTTYGEVRKALRQRPPRLAGLPTDPRGYPVPAANHWIDGVPNLMPGPQVVQRALGQRQVRHVWFPDPL